MAFRLCAIYRRLQGVYKQIGIGVQNIGFKGREKGGALLMVSGVGGLMVSGVGGVSVVGVLDGVGSCLPGVSVG